MSPHTPRLHSVFPFCMLLCVHRIIWSLRFCCVFQYYRQKHCDSCASLGNFGYVFEASRLGSNAIENEWYSRSLFPSSLEDLLRYILVVIVKNVRCSKRAEG